MGDNNKQYWVQPDGTRIPVETTVSKSASVTGLYRSLDMGEIILEGDEGSPDKKTWVKITKDDPWGWVIGMTVCVMVPNIRRAI